MHSGRPYIRDVELADKEWEANARGSARTLRALSQANVAPLAVSNARTAAARAELAELELAERKRDLIPAAEVKQTLIDVATSAKGKLLGLPARIKQRLPHLAAEDVRVIDDLLREALEGLADGVG